MWVQSLGRKDPLEKGRATQPSILAWRIPMERRAWQATVSPQGHKELDMTEATFTMQHVSQNAESDSELESKALNF